MDMKLEVNYRKKLEKHRKVDSKQCVNKQPIDQWRNQRKSVNTLRQKIKHNFQILFDSTKWF